MATSDSPKAAPKSKPIQNDTVAAQSLRTGAARKSKADDAESNNNEVSPTSPAVSRTTNVRSGRSSLSDAPTPVRGAHLTTPSNESPRTSVVAKEQPADDLDAMREGVKARLSGPDRPNEAALRLIVSAENAHQLRRARLSLSKKPSRMQMIEVIKKWVDAAYSTQDREAMRRLYKATFKKEFANTAESSKKKTTEGTANSNTSIPRIVTRPSPRAPSSSDELVSQESIPTTNRKRRQTNASDRLSPVEGSAKQVVKKKVKVSVDPPSKKPTRPTLRFTKEALAKDSNLASRLKKTRPEFNMPCTKEEMYLADPVRNDPCNRFTCRNIHKDQTAYRESQEYKEDYFNGVQDWGEWNDTKLYKQPPSGYGKDGGKFTNFDRFLNKKKKK